MSSALVGSYVVPLRRWTPEPIDEFARYLASLPANFEVIVVDGSAPDIFAVHAAVLPSRVRHVAIPAHRTTTNGKVGGVKFGAELASTERLVLADDDVRYDTTALAAVIARLDDAAIVRPQNYFAPLPWHALWDSSRSLLNRMCGGDWPGTLAVRRSALLETRGYGGTVLFENLALERAIRNDGGRACNADDVFVRRLPPTIARFMEQRVRQAYDELARPQRLTFFLSLWPAVAFGFARRAYRSLAFVGAAAIVCAEAGRQKRGAHRYVPVAASFFAPLWLAERATCSWIALARWFSGRGVRYGDAVLYDAVSSRTKRAGRKKTRRETVAMTFEEFLPEYLAAHADRRTQLVHAAGTAAGVALAVGALVRRKPALLPVALAAGYLPAWLSHWAIEGNQPKTFRYPLFSLRGDFVMAWRLVTGRLAAS